MQPPTLSIKQIISLSGQLYFENLFPILKVSLAGVIVSFPISWLMSSDDYKTHMLGLWLSPVSFFVTLLILGTLILLFDQISMGAPVCLSRAFYRSLTAFGRYFLCSVVAGLIICLGFFLLILPGIYLSVIFLFAPYFSLLDGRGVWESLKESKRIVKGDFWKILGVYALIILSGCFLCFYTVLIKKLMDGAMAFIMVGIMNVIIAVLWPLFVAIFYNLFTKLKKIKTVPAA